MKTGQIEVYDRLNDRKTVSTHKSWKLAEAAAKRLGCGDRFGLRENKIIREMKEIIYFADDLCLGGMTPEVCEGYRSWARDRIEEKFPEHKVSVVPEIALDIYWTDDALNENAIAEFCENLWERWPLR